jgi:hypothetical protein
VIELQEALESLARQEVEFIIVGEALREIAEENE